MRKLKLVLDELQVESFTATPEAGMEGTVHGNLGDQGPLYDDPSFNDCYGGGVDTVGTCIGPTYCCGVTWKPSCADTCINTQCGNSCWTGWCNTCVLDSCMVSCDQGISCTYQCGNCAG
jgi:hypothetical protein